MAGECAVPPRRSGAPGAVHLRCGARYAGEDRAVRACKHVSVVVGPRLEIQWIAASNAPKERVRAFDCE